MSENEENGSEELDEKLKKKIAEKRIGGDEFVIRNIIEKGKGFEDKSSREEFEKMKKRAEEAEAIIALEAEKVFLDEKEALLERFPEEQREELSERIGNDPDVLEQIETSLMVQGRKPETQTRKKRTKGKATLEGYRETGETGTEYSDYPEEGDYPDPTYNYIRDLYKTLRSPTSTKLEKERANRTIDELFKIAQKGLKSRPRSKPFRMPDVIMSCPKCHRTVAVDLEKQPCPFCGFQYGVK